MQSYQHLEFNQGDLSTSDNYPLDAIFLWIFQHIDAGQFWCTFDKGETWGTGTLSCSNTQRHRQGVLHAQACLACVISTLCFLHIPSLSRRETPLEAPSTHAFPEISTQASLACSCVCGPHIVCDRGSSGVSENKAIAFCDPSDAYDLALKFLK